MLCHLFEKRLNVVTRSVKYLLVLMVMQHIVSLERKTAAFTVIQFKIKSTLLFFQNRLSICKVIGMLVVLIL